ncbi:nicotinamide riboside transporter PnuC [Granulicoccus phenolivorans]|uniref:nicotinamide riboside transporter PnuC n=1 Tax=Granulicoccus phenolivorans TaxID=266854 RepID=UPI0003FF2682|nr:nicotinamide riboside transporter PnuC [Granulicoccus phenolivorans]
MGWTLTWTELAGFVTGAACVWLVVRRNIWNFPLGIANNIVFWFLFLGAGLYADAWLQVVYLVLGVLGWYWWLRGGEEHSRLVVRRTPRRGWWAIAAFLGAATATIYAVLTSHTDSRVPLGDALTTALSLGAQLMLNRKWLGNWVLWIVVDVLYVGLYTSKGLYLTAVLYAGFVVLAGYGLRQWRRAARVADPIPAGVTA